MSELSARECTAGISRRALETLHTPNGRKLPAPGDKTENKLEERRKQIEEWTKGTPEPKFDDGRDYFRCTCNREPCPVHSVPAEPPAPGSLAEHLAAAKQFGVNLPDKTSVVDLWDRQLDLLNLDGWNFRIRDVHHTASKLQVDTIALDRVQLEALGRRILELLAGGDGAE